jgi:hypothetical protein
LDISMEKNNQDLHRLLVNAESIFYADHHRSGEVPNHLALEAHIDVDANTCTALIVDKYLSGRFHHWAIAAAYGDNLIQVADELAKRAGLNTAQAAQLKDLGILINYNGYGARVEELHFDPIELFKQLVCYSSPFDVVADPNSPYHKLKAAYESDLNLSMSIGMAYESDILSVVCLPDSAWARRISGVMGNLLANQYPNRAHVVLTKNKDESYLVSLRAPLSNKQGAGTICSSFSTGGGREAAAGINRLPKSDLEALITQTEQYYFSSVVSK